MGLIDSIRTGTYVAVGDDCPRAGEVTELAETALRIAAGEEVMLAVRDFLDQLSRITDCELAAAIERRPELTADRRADALLAGVAEHLAATRDVPGPRWVLEPERFLDRFWFVSGVPGFRAIALAQTPIALKRRGVLWPARSMQRV